jgi:hypothetical protein
LADAPQRVTVSANTFIPRPDLGANTYTFVAAGEQVPPEAVPYM